VKRGSIRERADVNYAASSILVSKRYANPNYALTPLRRVIHKAQYGISLPATEEPIGLPMIRMNNLQNDGWDFTDLKYIELSEKEAELYRVKPGNILFNRTNSKELVGKCEVFRESGDWVFASYLIRIVLDQSQAIPDFVSTFLNTKAGRIQIDRVSRQIIGMSNVNAEELQDLLIPNPPLEIQRSLVAEIEAARQNRKQKLAQADKLLSSLDVYLLDQLGLTPPEESDKQVFSVRLRDVKTRFDVDYHTLRFRNLRRMLEGNSSYPVMTIGEICQTSPRSGFAAGRQDQAFNEDEGVPHIRPLNIKPFGEITFEGTKYVPRECINNDDLLVHNEVLFNNTNSMEWVGKSAVFTGDRKCACSNHITRLLLKKDIAEPFFLATLFNALRSLGFLGILSTNFNNQAGINIETLSCLRIPVPSLNEQRFIISEIQKRRAEAQRLRQEAETEWEAAKTCFERKLLGEEA
jgi:type I restriction enzyme, S subunit